MSQTHFLPPHKLQICRKDGAHFLKMDGQRLKIAPPRRALPLSNPDEFIVLCDEEGQEIGVIEHLGALEPASREVLGAYLAQLYQVTPITKILEVEREPLSGQIRWRVETENLEAENEPTPPEKSGAVRLLKRAKKEARQLELEARHELTFLIAGAEDVQASRYPQVFLTDVDGNRYEITNYETLDLNSRRISQQYI